MISKLGFKKAERSSAESALTKYLEAWENVNPKEMYLYISYYDRENLSQQEYVEQFLEYPIRPLGHNIKSVVQDGNSAKALVEVSWPDFISAESVKRDEIFYLVQEGIAWKVRESVSFVK